MLTFQNFQDFTNVRKLVSVIYFIPCLYFDSCLILSVAPKSNVIYQEKFLKALTIFIQCLDVSPDVNDYISPSQPH